MGPLIVVVLGLMAIAALRLLAENLDAEQISIELRRRSGDEGA